MAAAPHTNADADVPPRPGPAQRAVWTAVIMLAAVIVGVGAGVLSWVGGANPPNAVIAGFAAIAFTTMFGFAVFNFVTGRAA
jgi:hypothetical protein